MFGVCSRFLVAAHTQAVAGDHRLLLLLLMAEGLHAADQSQALGWRLLASRHDPPSRFFTLSFSPSSPWHGTDRLLDIWYGLWLPSVSLSIAFFLALPGARIRRRFVLSCVLIWVSGAWIYVSLPTLGPIYAFRPYLEEVLPEIPQASSAQAMLWDNYEKVVAGALEISSSSNLPWVSLRCQASMWASIGC